jgi:NADPH-dependent curcumin reductase CurA
MSKLCNRQIHLINRPKGLPVETDFAMVETEVGPPPEGTVLVRNLFMSVDPYMRGRMNEGKSYAPAFQLNQPMQGRALGEVIKSNSQALVQGDIVLSNYGWRQYFHAPASELRKVSRDVHPLSVYLGALGMTGMTAWVGLRLAELKPTDVVFISGAAGAVGAMAGQLARLRSCRVIGSAGSKEKCELLQREYRFDAAIDYKADPQFENLKLAAPDGIDVYFDNVGGKALEAALSSMRLHGRIIACGSISGYNDVQPTPGPSNLFNIIGKRLTVKGFLVSDWLDQLPEFEREVGDYYKSGKLIHKETLAFGIEQAIPAFIGLFHGNNIGKMIVKLG